MNTTTNPTTPAGNDLMTNVTSIPTTGATGSARTRRILIGTIGGQGGGVLSSWLVRGLIIHGWEAISIGLLGLSQRAGTVTYYVEAAPKTAGRRIHSVFATAGDVDLLLGQELLELGRLVQGGYASPNGYVIGNTYRYQTTLEKMPAEGGVFSSASIINGARKVAPGRNYLLHAQEIVQQHRLPALTSNAFLLGAVVASPVFRMPVEPFLQAIAEDGVSVESSSAAFRLGHQMMQDGSLAKESERSWREHCADESDTISERLLELKPQAALATLLNRCADSQQPARQRKALTAAVALLAEYQDARYVEHFAQKLRAMETQAGVDLQHAHGDLFETLCVNLANWMSYEDPFRVAQLKTSPERYLRMAADFHQASGLMQVRDYMVPDLSQLIDALPPRLASWFGGSDTSTSGAPAAGKSATGKLTHASPKFALRMRSNSVSGYWLMRLLAALRRIRPYSLRQQREERAIDDWLQAVAEAARSDLRIAIVLAEAGRVVKGYGWTREKAMSDIANAVSAMPAMLAEVARRGGDPLICGRDAVAAMAREAGSWPAGRRVLEQAVAAEPLASAKTA